MRFVLPKFASNLRISMLLVLGVGFVVPLVGHFYFFTQQKRIQLVAVEQENQRQILKLLAGASAYPLYSYSKDDLKSFVANMAQDHTVERIQIFEINQQPFLDSRSLDSSQQTLVASSSEHESSIDIFYNNIFVGKALVTFKPGLVDQALLEAQKETIKLLFTLLVSCAVLIYLMLQRKVILPMQRLKRQATEMVQLGTSSSEYKWSNLDEIGEVGKRLTESKRQIDLVYSELQLQNAKLEELNVNLEARVSEKTAQIVQSGKMASLGEMAGGIAHEINNPLAIIHGRMEQVSRQLKQPTIDVDFLKASVETVLKTTQRIAKVIKYLRVFSRNVDLDAPFEKCHLQEIVDDTLTLVREKLKSNGVELRLNPVPPVVFMGNSILISQVMVNLLNNAFDAVRVLDEKWIQLQFDVESDLLAVRIVDSGRGIPAKIVNKVMEPFFTTKEVGQGTGIGLSISKGIIDSHQGSLWIDHRSENTCFVIEIPLQEKVNYNYKETVKPVNRGEAHV